jgi:flavin-dependent dehydrogenase
MIASYEAAVLGGGPAGIAAAFGLAKRGRRAVVFERSRYEGPRFGETLGPEIRPLLSEIGAWERFADSPMVPFRTIVSSWGTSELRERPSILHPLGAGWHVDRAAVDRALACAAAESGVAVHSGTGFCALARTESGWEVTPARGPTVNARFLVDASGRGAPATASAFAHRRWVKADRLIAASVRFGPSGAVPAAGELLLESAEAGWWYSVPQPDGALLVTLMTDADLLPAGGRKALERAWRRAFAQTLYTCARAGSLEGDCVRTVRADSGFCSPDSGPGWLAIGDAAMGCDPLSGSGFARALRSGLEAAVMVDRTLGGENAEPNTEARFSVYLRRRAEYYSVERRWSGSSFWVRRIGGAEL